MLRKDTIFGVPKIYKQMKFYIKHTLVSGLFQYVYKKYCIEIRFFNTGLLANMLGVGIKVWAQESTH